MYNVIYTESMEIQSNYIFTKKEKAEGFFKISLLEKDPNAKVSKALHEGQYIHEEDFKGGARKLWSLHISEAKKLDK